jgi:hypothetical protein
MKTAGKKPHRGNLAIRAPPSAETKIARVFYGTVWRRCQEFSTDRDEEKAE